MRYGSDSLRAFLLALAIAAPADAQWLNYPTAGLPRDARGKPNLSAPAPRATDGKPDLSGVWQLEGRCPPEGCIDDPVGAEFGNRCNDNEKDRAHLIGR